MSANDELRERLILHLCKEHGFIEGGKLTTGKEDVDLIADDIDTILPIIHEQVAGALGTSRVVVSRILKQLERQGRVLLFRHQIKWMGEL